VIVVDTSVWISALRSPGSPETAILRGLLDADEVALAAPVRSELLMGVRGARRNSLADALGALPVLYPSDETWRTLDDWSERASAAGHFFSLGDLLIGILASDAGALVWSLDRDFERLARLDLVRLYG
jgi:predicted nucleic acid-binding protein